MLKRGRSRDGPNDEVVGARGEYLDIPPPTPPDAHPDIDIRLNGSVPPDDGCADAGVTVCTLAASASDGYAASFTINGVCTAAGAAGVGSVSTSAGDAPAKASVWFVVNLVVTGEDSLIRMKSVVVVSLVDD